MKTYLSILLLITLCCACSKKNDDPPANNPDRKEWFTSKTWTGEYKDPGRPHAQAVYSLAFGTGGNVVLSTIMGDSTGTYTLDKDKLVMSFYGNAIKISATVTDDSKLSDIQHLTASNWEMVSGSMNKANTTQPLDGTTWKGSFTQAGSITLAFAAGNLVTFDDDIHPYQRREGGVIRFYWVDHRFTSMFMVITASNTINGYYIDGFGNYNSFQAIKQ